MGLGTNVGSIDLIFQDGAPMITGKTRVPADLPVQDAQGGSVKALVVALLIAAAAVYVAAGG